MKIGIFGAAGTIGHATAAALASSEHTLVLVGRDKAKLEREFAYLGKKEIRPADLATPEGCAAAAAGLDLIIYALGLPYSAQAFAAYPQMMRDAIAAANDARVNKFIHVSNVYPYAPPKSGLVGEEHERTPPSVKGRYRKQQEDVVLAADREDGLRTIVLRPPDYFGPRAVLSLAHVIFESALAGKAADVLAPITTPHEFVYVEDLGRIIATLVGSRDAWGEAYNVPGSGHITMKAFAEKIYAAAGQPKAKLRAAGPFMVKILGLFVPIMRELGEMQYLQATPVNLDSTKLREVLGSWTPTSYDEGIKKTLAYMKVSLAS
jgi:nucleoside-diphosphate-sugar epimerase